MRPAVTASPKATAKPKAHSAVQVYPKGTEVVSMTVTDPAGCWVGLTPRGGSQKSHTYPGGASKTWTETKPLTMIFGNPSGIKLTVNGKAEKMNPNQVATVTIDPASQNPVTIG